MAVMGAKPLFSDRTRICGVSDRRGRLGGYALPHR